MKGDALHGAASEAVLAVLEESSECESTATIHREGGDRGVRGSAPSVGGGKKNTPTRHEKARQSGSRRRETPGPPRMHDGRKPGATSTGSHEARVLVVEVLGSRSRSDATVHAFHDESQDESRRRGLEPEGSLVHADAARGG